MSLVFRSLFDGSLRDISGNGNNGTLTAGNGGFRYKELGQALKFDGADTKIDTGSDWIGTGDITIMGWIYPKSFGEGNIGAILDNGKVQFRFSSSYNRLFFSSGSSTYSANDSIDLNRWYHIAVTRASDGTANFYIDGSLSGLADQNSGTPASGTTNVIIGNRDIGDRTFDGYIVDLKVWNEISSISQIEQEYNGSKNFYGIIKSKRNFFYPAPEDLSNESGLVGAYNMKTTDGKVIDISGNGNHGTINGATDTKGIFGRALSFDGVDDTVTLGNIGNIKSIAMTIKLNSTTEKILEGAANDKLIHANVGTLTYPEFDNAYINGVDTDTITSRDWVDIVITSSTNVDMSAVTLALNNATYGNLIFDDLRFYSTELTLQNAKDYHNKIAKQVLLTDNCSDYGADGITQSNHIGVYTINSGAFKVSEDSTSKYIECVSNGVIETPYDNLDSYENGYLKIVDGDLLGDEGSTVDDASAFAVSGTVLQITMTAGQKLRKFEIERGVEQ